ncbi:MAG TPA: alkaline phosphatase family protein, partial [Thermoleophilaceae bacterium]
WEQIAGNPSAPYLNGLLRRGAVETNYFAITHPSLPNYLALTTGGHQNVKHDCSACRDSGQSLANQLQTAGISWRAYFENIRNPLATHWSTGQAYNPHYNPFAYISAARRSDPVGDVTNFAALRHDLRAQELPGFAWIAPNIWHDGHSVKLAKVDRYASKLVPKIVRALGPKGVLFVTWDEGPESDLRGAHGIGGGHIPLIALGPGARNGTRVAVRANHYALLRTIEDHFGLPRLGHARDSSTPSLAALTRAFRSG